MSTSSNAEASDADGWDHAQRERFAAVAAHIDRQAADHAYLSVVFGDTQTGRTWRYGPADHPGWTASTIKLAMATDILARQRSGQLTLTDPDRHDMHTMLNWSDNDAADRLWRRYGGEDQLGRFRDRFGMADLYFVPGFSNGTTWGFVKCTSEDLWRLMRHVLTEPHPEDRDHLLAEMRTVAPNQQWGAWAAGEAQAPGDKNGWSYESDPYGKHWVLNTVGFAGPDARYPVAVMFQVAPGGTIDYGAHTVSDVVALLFGQPIPAPIMVPPPDD